MAAPALVTILLNPLASAAGDDGNDLVPSGHARAAQMTAKEYRAIKKGMSPAQVRRIVDSRGTLVSSTKSCLHRTYTSSNPIPGQDYGVIWMPDDEGAFEVSSKHEPGTLQFCPGESRR